MRLPPSRLICSKILCGCLSLIAGCANPSSPTLTSLMAVATPSVITVGAAAGLRAMANLSDGTVQAAPTAAATTAPAIVWQTPAAIQYGTALSGAQLSARASAPGAFAYFPAAGTVLNAGTQTLSVTFTPADTKTYSTVTASVNLVVNQAKPVIAWPPPTSVTTGTALSAIQLNAKASVPGTFTYSPPLGTVLLTGTRPLTAAFVPSDAVDYTPVTANAAIAVQAEPSKIAPKVTWNTPSAVLYGTALSSAQLDATANAPGTFTYAPAAGTVLKAGTQLLSVSFTPTNTVAFSKTNASVLITVTKATPVVTWTPLRNITPGTPLGVAQLNAVANVPGTFSYSPTTGSILPVGTQRLAATFSPNDAVDYAPVTVNNPLTIVAAEAATPTITWKVPAAITYGTALGSTQLNATANAPGSFAYTPSAGTVLTRGRRTLTAVFTPSDTKAYTTVTASLQFTVNPATPLITWGTPNPITAGTALSAAQLNANANVPGSFTYSPAAGAVLAAGTHQLTVAFSPADINDYSNASAQASLVVNASSSGSGGPTGCGGPTINLNNGMSQSALQSAITNAPNCALIVFAAGTYTISSTLVIPCNNLTITGPAVFPNTAILNASFNNTGIFTMWGGCTGMSLEYLAGYNAGLLYVGPGNSSNINFLHNTTGGLPSSATSLTQYGTSGSVYFDGKVGQTLSNVTIEYNSFGDTNSCTAVFTLAKDSGGLCAGVLIHQGVTTNITIRYNKFFHLEEGMHVFQVAGNYVPGAAQSASDNLDVEYNYFLNTHRIEVEIQDGTINHPTIVSNNIFQDQSDAYYGSLGLSTPCCQFSTITGTDGMSPGLLENNNVSISSLKSPYGCTFCGDSSNSGPAFAHEFWGNGSHADNNLIQGNFGNGIEWGYGAGSWEIKNNQMCGPNMALNKGNEANFISNEEGQSNPPSQSGNVTSASCSAITSVAPAISPASGSYTGSQTITLADSGVTSGAGPQGNTSIYYTTDGSTPVPGSGTTKLYSGPFSLTAPGTVRAVGLYGSGGTNPQTWPTVYPAGLGYVPSGVVSATYVAAAVAQSPVAKVSASTVPHDVSSAPSKDAASAVATATLQSVAITPAQPAVAIGSTTQLKAVATFNDGSVKDVTAEFGWQSSDTRTIAANASGVLSGLATGPATISGNYQGVQASVAASSGIGQVDWSGPIVISAGGTYTGNWQSTDSKTPAVTVATTDPVTIENAHMQSAGSLIKTSVAGSNLTVRNSLGMALNAAVKGQPNGNFLDVTSPARLDVENNYVENAQGGVIVHGYAGKREGDQTIVIRANRARNLNGLLSDGNGSYLPGEGSNRSQAHFIQFDSVQSVPGIDVGWNEVINYPGHSLVEDNIDVYRSSGTANQPLEIHDTYIQGAYPYRPAQDAYTGGGIKAEGRLDDSAQDAPAFISIHDNQVVGTVNYGIDFAAGHDNIAANNRVVSSGMLSDGTKIAAQGVGLANGATAGASASMYNNTMRDNLVGWMCWKSSCAQTGYRKDQFFPASPADYSTNSLVPAGQVTFNMENNEYQVWLNKLSAAAVSVGPAF
jgi:hypothetical protein